MSVLGVYLLLLALFYRDGMRFTASSLSAAGQMAQRDDDDIVNFIVKGAADQQVVQQIQHQDQTASVYLSGSEFPLKVQVNDMSTRHVLSLATVEVYVNYTRTNSALTTEDGRVFLHVPYQLGLPLTIVASMDSYLLTLLPWKTTRIPIFSAVTMSLLSIHQGNIWWFDDSVLITGKTSDALSQPRVQFPKSLLNLTDRRSLSSFRAYITTPQPPTGKDRYTTGLLINQSGYSSIELSPIAAVSAQLLSNGREIQVTGPVQITLPLGDNSGLQASHAVPAWSFDHTTGAWMNRGLGIMKMEEGKLFWTFMAPHLGYWIAAPMPSIKGMIGYMGHATPMDFISYHSSLIVAVLGGTLVFLVGVLAVMLCCRSEPKTKRIHATKMASLKMDQTTTTNDNQLCEVSSQDSTHSEDISHQLLMRGDGKLVDSATSKYNDDFNIYIEGTDLIGSESSRPLQQALLVNSSDILWTRDISEGIKIPLSLNEILFLQDRLLQFHNQPVAILHAPGLWSSPEQHSPGCRSATLPRTGAMYDLGQGQTVGMDNLTQTLPKVPLATLERSQGHGREGLHGDTSTFKPESWSRYYSSLPESVSVPGMLSEARVRGGHRPGGERPFFSELQEADQNSEQTPSELTWARPSPLAPRAWFVSLEGKPAAEICRNSSSATDSKRKRRAAGDSRDTSLDSGVDMSEPNNQPTVGNRQTTLDRSGTFVKRATLHIKPPLLVSGEELNKKCSGKGAMGGQTLIDDAPLGTVLDVSGSSGTATNVSQERGEGRSACPERQ
ncbi:protein FAM171B-like isoform X3 [Salvelinus fontinalis]|uniref:protein FAM171B-like isoform X3 n=1 Tax=Salvelinus fontinalis TaxID=8038 RepID=UPI002484E26A|nr:protein FAM171B-like isoform X3 [Salvelinus fontinalis]